jgi:putative transposase
VDLIARRHDKVRRGVEVVDDLDVFERYYAEHPDSTGFEVFDE